VKWPYVVEDLGYSSFRIGDSEIDYGVNSNGDIIMGDDLLGWDIP